MSLTDFQLTHKEARMSIAATLAAAQVQATGVLPPSTTVTPQSFVRDQFELWYQFVNAVAIPDETIFTSPPVPTPVATATPAPAAKSVAASAATTPTTATQTAQQAQLAQIFQGINPAAIAPLVAALSLAVAQALPQTAVVAGQVAAVANGVAPVIDTAINAAPTSILLSTAGS